MELGCKLVRELQLDNSVDTLGRWMAHHVAGLMQDAEQAEEKDRPEKMTACREAILTLWKHRYDDPFKALPLNDLKPVFAALSSLDPDDDTPRYHRISRPSADEGNDEGEPQQWLKRADHLDHSAKLLIGYCLKRAAEDAVDKSKEWIELAQTAEADVSLELTLLDFIEDENGFNIREKPTDEVKIERIKDRIQRLESFEELSRELRKEFSAKFLDR